MTHTVKLKAYIYDLDYRDGLVDVVFASTRGRATATVAREFGCDFIGVQLRRASEFDDCAPGPPTAKQWLDRGYLASCDQCERLTDPEEAVVSADGMTTLCARCSNTGDYAEEEVSA